MYPQNLRVSRGFSTSFGLHNIIETSRVIGTESKITSSAESTIIHVNRLKKHENSSCRRLPHDPHVMGMKGCIESLGYQVQDICSNGITAFNLIISHKPQIAVLECIKKCGT